jgi:AcrR family transcriptional regulator
MSVTKNAVIQAASDIADKEGLNRVSLKAVSEKLNIRTPSLYNHIAGLDDMLLEVAHSGMRIMNDQMTQAVIGKHGDAALKSLGIAYLNYVTVHPGIYETIQWAHWHGNDETSVISGNYRSLMRKLVLSCSFKTKKNDEILELFMSMLHGYSSMQLGKGLSDPESAVQGIAYSIEIVLSGLHAKYD